MGNMSYCRFQNTLADLQDCMDELYELDGDLSELSSAEKRAAKSLIELCNEIIVSYGHVVDQD